MGIHKPALTNGQGVIEIQKISGNIRAFVYPVSVRFFLATEIQYTAQLGIGFPAPQFCQLQEIHLNLSKTVCSKLNHRKISLSDGFLYVVIAYSGYTSMAAVTSRFRRHDYYIFEKKTRMRMSTSPEGEVERTF